MSNGDEDAVECGLKRELTEGAGNPSIQEWRVSLRQARKSWQPAE
jgi:hypothetical protein